MQGQLQFSPMHIHSKVNPTVLSGTYSQESMDRMAAFASEFLKLKVWRLNSLSECGLPQDFEFVLPDPKLRGTVLETTV